MNCGAKARRTQAKRRARPLSARHNQHRWAATGDEPADGWLFSELKADGVAPRARKDPSKTPSLRRRGRGGRGKGLASRFRAGCLGVAAACDFCEQGAALASGRCRWRQSIRE